MPPLTPEQEERFRRTGEENARLKLLLDGPARLEYARQEGFEQGLRKAKEKLDLDGYSQGFRQGMLLGQISVLQEYLGVAQSMRDELLSFDEGQLSKLMEQLQRQLRSRDPQTRREAAQ